MYLMKHGFQSSLVSKFQIRLENYHFWKITHPKPQDPHLLIVNSTLRKKLEQLERLGSEDTPRRPMITHTIDQFISDPKSKQDESQKIRKICEKFKLYNFVLNLTRNTPSNGSDYMWQIWK